MGLTLTLRSSLQSRWWLIKSIKLPDQFASSLLKRNIMTTRSIFADHLKVTKDQQREEGVHQVTVTRIKNISPTVKKLTLSTNIRPVPYHFKAGQWLDFFIPGLKQVGGFSMTNHFDPETGDLELAVKFSDNPPSAWVHNKCNVGTEVGIRIGGDFYFDCETSLFEDTALVFLIAGGVGINPLCSIFSHIHNTRSKGNKRRLPKVCLLFSAKTRSELLFKNELDEITRKDEEASVRYFLTGERGEDSSLIKYRRITGKDIEEILEKATNQKLEELRGKILVYLCGPSPMIQSIEEILKNGPAQIEERKIFYETWWVPSEAAGE